MESVLNISAHKYGNYHKYYDFHPANTRTSLMERDSVFLKLWKAQNEPETFAILDIGCNEGDLSIDVMKLAIKELPSHVKVILLGIDIDSSLIDLAIGKYCKDSSLNGSVNVEFRALSFMEVIDGTVAEYLSSYLAKHNISGFHFISMFSITMWIHLNHDDDGLKQFISRGIIYLSEFGSILIEPQPWKCYKNANKRCRKLGLAKPLFYTDLKIRDIDNDITKYVMNECKLKSFWCLGKEVWGRSLLVFHKSEHPVLAEPLIATISVAADKNDVTVNEKKTEANVGGAVVAEFEGKGEELLEAKEKEDGASGDESVHKKQKL